MTPTPAAPTISCPAPVTAASVSGAPVAVNFTVPAAAGGVAPLTTTCTPPSGTLFAIGSTPVTCTVRDAQQRAASCTFAVTVTPPPPQLAATRFVAFGDSITAGFPEHPCRTFAPTLETYLTELRRARPPEPAPPGSYPERLRVLLAARYSSQTFTVANEGNPGESIVTGRADLQRVLALHQPEVLLLQEGANDMNQAFFGVDAERQMATVVESLREMIRIARRQGVLVFVGNLLPQRSGACRGLAAGYIGPVNDRIRFMVAGESATLVDLYGAFGGVASTELIDVDGLHPTATGLQRMADTFFEAVRSRLER
jgi:lysophospholipase L1-like esterase